MDIEPAECFVSVDVETAGPIPGRYSLLSIGACVVGRVEEKFYVELRPINGDAVPDAIAASGLSLAVLAKTGIEPQAAMEQFRDWALGAAAKQKPVFVGFDAGFDWSFVNWYFHSYLGENPFGFAPLDIKSYYMGFAGCEWAGTKSSRMPAEFRPGPTTQHNALDDAVAQAQTLTKLIAANVRR